MNIVEFIKFALPEYQILHSARLYGLFSLREKKRAHSEEQDTRNYYNQPVIVPMHGGRKAGGNILSDFILFLLIMGFPLYLVTTAPYKTIEDILAIYHTGYALIDSGYMLLGVIFSIPLIGISFIFAPTRRIYYRMPWLLPFIILFSVNLLILSISYLIINTGFYVLDEDRTALYSLFMIGQLLLSRLLLSIWLYKKPITHLGGTL